MSMDIKTALEAFKKLGVKTETGKKAADDMIDKGKESPQCGALAFLHRDEDEGKDGQMDGKIAEAKEK